MEAFFWPGNTRISRKRYALNPDECTLGVLHIRSTAQQETFTGSWGDDPPLRAARVHPDAMW